jgi:hypothetical protein
MRPSSYKAMSMALRKLVKRRAAWALVAALAVTSACEDLPNTPTDTVQTKTFLFSARLQRGAFAWRTVTFTNSGQVTVQLVSITPQTDAVVSLGFGTFDGTTCNLTTTIETASATTPQITTEATAGTYCVRVGDLGTLTADWTFGITIVTPL